jgi:hypothetical protein
MPNEFKAIEAGFRNRRIPQRRSSVSIDSLLALPDSRAANASTFFERSVRGISNFAEYGTVEQGRKGVFSRTGSLPANLSFKPATRFARESSSKLSARSKWAGVMALEPRWTASKREKKIARRACSVYLSNTRHDFSTRFSRQGAVLIN